MFLDQVQRAESLPYGHAIRQVREFGFPVPEIMHLFAFRPDRNQFLSRFTHELM
jgi:hypothetical protein